VSLFSPEELTRMRTEYEAKHPKPKTKAEILVEIVREDPTCTVAELAEAATRSKSWVRRVLRRSGIVLAKPARQKGVGRDR
jgi:transposase